MIETRPSVEQMRGQVAAPLGTAGRRLQQLTRTATAWAAILLVAGVSYAARRRLPEQVGDGGQHAVVGLHEQ